MMRSQLCICLKEKRWRGLNLFKKTTQTKLLCLQRKPRSRTENLWALQTVLQQSVPPSDLISLLQLLISHAPVEPGRHSSRTESSQRSPHLGSEFCRANIDWLFSVSLTTQFLFFMSLSPSHTLRLISCLSFTCAPSFSLSDLCLLWFPPLSPHPRLSPTTFFFPSSGPVRHQCGLFCRCDGASDADADSGGVHAVCSGFLQCLRALHGRRHKEGETARWRQQRRGRQEEFWESLWQGQDRTEYMSKFTSTSTEIISYLGRVPHWLFLQQLLHRSLNLSVACLSASHQFCLPVWVNCDSTVIQLQLFDAVAIILAVSLCWIAIWLLSPLSQTVASSIPVHLAITSFQMLPTNIRPLTIL